MQTIHCQLIASEHDICGYITYVFKSLDEAPFGKKYLMLTRLPNWDHRPIDLQERGYLTFKEVEAGVDKWYCPETGQMIPYNYTNIYFIKFVKEQVDNKKDVIL